MRKLASTLDLPNPTNPAVLRGRRTWLWKALLLLPMPKIPSACCRKISPVSSASHPKTSLTGPLSSGKAKWSSIRNPALLLISAVQRQ